MLLCCRGCRATHHVSQARNTTPGLHVYFLSGDDGYSIVSTNKAAVFKMYCPTCSTEASTDQKFCRSCGMELQAVAVLVSAQTTLKPPDAPKEEFLHRRQRTMLISGLILTIVAVAAGSSLKLLSKEHIQVAGDFTPYLNVILLLIAFFGMGLMCYPFLQMIVPARKSGRALAQQSATAANLLTGKQASITDHTTEFLEVSDAAVQERDTSPQSDQRDLLS